MDAPDAGLLSLAGVLMQFLRGYKWFGDWTTVAVGLGVAALMVVTNHHPGNVADFAALLTTHAEAVFAALGLSHIVSSVSDGKVAPKFNQISNGGKP